MHNPSLRRRIPVALAVGLAATTAIAAPQPADAAAAQRSTVSLTVGTYNIIARTSTQTFREAVSAVLPRVDVVGFQEVNSREKGDVLKSFRASGWSTYRQQPASQTPIMWRSSRFTLVSARTAKISGKMFIGHEKPGTGPYAAAKYVSVVRLRDNASHKNVSLINAHLISGAVKNGVKRPGRGKMYRVYTTQIANLAKVARAENRWGRVFTFGDFNISWKPDRKKHKKPLMYSTFSKRMGMPSMWASGCPETGGTRLDAFLDQVYSETRATSARVAYDISQYSDHRPAIATYALWAS